MNLEKSQSALQKSESEAFSSSQGPPMKWVTSARARALS